MRASFAADDIKCLGRPSPIVPVPVGEERVARLASSLLPPKGVFANLVEFPAVAVGTARFRMQVMARHNERQVATAAAAVASAIAEARLLLTKADEPTAGGVTS